MDLLSLGNLGIIHWRNGNYAQALAYLQQSVTLHHAIGHSAGLAKLMNSIAGVYFEQGDLNQALTYVQQSADYYQAIGDRLGLAHSWGNLALVYKGLGKYDLALAYNQQDLDAARVRGNLHSTATALGNRGSIHEDRGDFDQALSCVQQAVQIEEELGNTWEIARHRGSIGLFWKKKGDRFQALAYLDQALPALRAHGARYYIVRPLLIKAEILYDEGRYDEARQYNQEAGLMAAEINRQDIVLLSAILTAQLDFALGDRTASQQLKDLLIHTQDSAGRAKLNYHLWKMTQDKAYAEAAIALYRQLYRAKPYFEYKLCLDELFLVQAKEASAA